MSASVSSIKPRTPSVPLLALILGLPVVFALVGLGSWEFATTNRQTIEAHLAEVAKSTAHAMDAKLTGLQAAGLALAAMDELRAGTVPPTVLKEARRIAGLLGVNIVVQEVASPGVNVFNTLLPADARMLPREMQPDHHVIQAAVDAVVRTCKPQVTDVFIGPVTHRHTVAVVLPVVQDGVVTRLIILAVPTEVLGTWLAEQAADTEGFAAIRDRNGNIVAASRDNEHVSGRPVPEWSRIPPDEDGIREGLNLHGENTLFAYEHLHLAPNFAVVVARPMSGFLSIIKGPAKWLMVSGLAMAVLGVLSLVAIWTRRNTEVAALQEVNRLLSGAPAILYVNRVYPGGGFRRRFLSLSAERITGWSNRELAREGALTEKTEAAFVEGRNAFFRTALETGRGQFEYRMRFADGTLHWMRVVGVCLSREPDGSGDVLGFITDITEERAIREELRRTERFAALGEVAGRISHEMNQPMAAISMAAENGQRALDRVPVNLDMVRDRFIRIEQQVERVIAIIGHISAFGRKGVPAERTELDMARVIRAALTVAEPKIERAMVSVRVDVPDDLPAPTGVAVLVEQIIVNLVVNACDAYQDRPERPERTVTIAAFVSDGAYVMRVADHAGGIPADLLERIFDPFVTTKPPEKGTGLGLSFCLTTVRRLGGNLTVANADGGARFDVTLPIAVQLRQSADAA